MIRLPNRIHKRPFIVAAIVLLAVIAVTAGLIFGLGLFSANSDLLRVHVYASESGLPVNSIGINLTHIPTANLLSNASFENLQYDQNYMVSEASANAVYVQSDSSADEQFRDGFFTGGTIRILSLDAEGNLIPKVQSTITGFETNQLGLWAELDTPEGNASGRNITSAASSTAISVAVGNGGLLISDLTSSSPKILETGTSEDFAGIFSIADRFYAVTDGGTFALSSDGRAWNAFSPAETLSGKIHTVTAVGKTGIAAGDSGTVLMCSDGKVSRIPIDESSSFLTSTGDGNVVLLAGTDGAVWTSANGIAFRDLSEGEITYQGKTPDWVASDCRGGTFALAGADGQIAVGKYFSEAGQFSFTIHQAQDSAGSDIKPERIIVLPSGELVLVDSSGILYCSDSGAETWKQLSAGPLNEITSLGLTSAGKILLSNGVISYTSQLFTCIQFEDVQNEEKIQSGDMCFLACTSPAEGSAEKGGWDQYGDGTNAVSQETAPAGGGSSSIRLIGSETLSGDDAHYVSTVISDGDSSPFQPNLFYQMKVWLKQTGVANGEVMAWISGDFTSVGTTFTDVGSGWRQYTYTFVLPSAATGKNTGEIRFNIGFRGRGELSIDKVYLGLESAADTSVPDAYCQSVKDAKLSLIRLDNIGFGRFGMPSDAWLYPSGNECLTTYGGITAESGCNSLEASLSIVSDSGANPWLVIDSAAGQDSVEHLMNYLCGSITDTYGKIRVENGTAVPWSSQFERLVIEITDTNGVFTTDLQRGAYVDYIMKAFESSDYFVDIKDKVIFVDGMQYESGTMLSGADFHTGSLSVTNKNDALSYVLTLDAAISEGYEAYYDSIPRTLSDARRDQGEWIRIASLSMFSQEEKDGSMIYSEEPVTAADCTAMLLYDLGNHSSTILSDLPVNTDAAKEDSKLLFSSSGKSAAEKLLSARNNKTILAATAILQGIAGGTPNDIEIIPSALSSGRGEGTGLPAEAKGLSVFAFQDENSIHVVAVNISDEPKIFLLEADVALRGDYLYRYADDGSLIEQTKLSQRGNRINLLPGQVITAEIPLP